MIRASLVAALAGLLLACPALAQPAAEPRAEDSASDIVVTGELPGSGEVTRQARAISAPRGLRYYPLPRFEGERLCPGVVGLGDDYATLMIDRIRANAERLDLWMTQDDGTCRANFIVAFVDDGQDIMQQIAERWPERFRGMDRRERLTLLDDDGPVRVWTSTAIRSREGMPVAQDPITGTTYVGTVHATRLYLPMREDITGVLVLFDRQQASGKTLFQLADYATMRGLARTRPADGDGQALDTILTLFDRGATPPGELTAFDRAYLAALYAGLPNVVGLSKIVGVSGQLRRQAKAAQAAAGE